MTTLLVVDCFDCLFVLLLDCLGLIGLTLSFWDLAGECLQVRFLPTFCWAIVELISSLVCLILFGTAVFVGLFAC